MGRNPRAGLHACNGAMRAGHEIAPERPEVEHLGDELGDTIHVAAGCYGNDVSGGCDTGEIWPVRMRGGRSILGDPRNPSPEELTELAMEVGA